MSKKHFNYNSIPFLEMYNNCKISTSIQLRADSIVQGILSNQRRYQEIALLVREEHNRPTFYRWPLFPTASPGIPVEERIKINRSVHGLPENEPVEEPARPNLLSFGSKRRIGGKPIMSYDTLGALIPWYFIGLIHYRESDCDFSRHLHNGDPLKHVTRKVPKLRPFVGHGPPFSFVESAVDALIYQGKQDNWNDHWDLKNILIRLEKYNGFGYEMYWGVNSPYLWGGTNYYTTGSYQELKENNYASKWYPKVPSNQIGTAVLLKRMEQMGKISVPKS